MSRARRAPTLRCMTAECVTPDGWERSTSRCASPSRGADGSATCPGDTITSQRPCSGAALPAGLFLEHAGETAAELLFEIAQEQSSGPSGNSPILRVAGLLSARDVRKARSPYKEASACRAL